MRRRKGSLCSLGEISPVINRAIEVLYKAIPLGDISLREHRRDRCIYNDSICKEVSAKGVWAVDIVTSTDTGKKADGTYHPDVPHGHTIPVIEISDEWVAVIDISCAQFAALNADLDREFLLSIVKRSDLELFLQNAFGGGQWD
ncbi:MAG: hypothetical protein PHS44_06340 [Candidatus Dojkabacteria bacterium]|nr:hypothetical protein [Candidatus Dojkabacteria bacterium]